MLGLWFDVRIFGIFRIAFTYRRQIVDIIWGITLPYLPRSFNSAQGV